MTAEQITAWGPAFAAFTQLFSRCFPRSETRRHVVTYGRGLRSDLPRKSVEPIALAAGTAVRTLQEFLTHHVWDHERMRDELQRRVVRDHLPAQPWLVKAAQVHLSRGGAPLDRTHWLIVAKNAHTGEMKYFLSNAPPRTALQTLLEVAFTRANVEHVFRVLKSEIGFSHFEGRSSIGLMRHMILCQLLMTFVAEQTDRLRGEKSGDHARTSRPGPQYHLSRGSPPRLQALAG
jgi:SRSO17 transposase